MKKISLKISFFMNILLTMSNVLFPLITFPYITRVLTAEGIGKVSFATSIITYFVLFSQLGIPTYGIRACARVKDDKDKLTKVVKELFFLNFIMSIISYIIFFIMFFNVKRIHDDYTLFLILSSTILLNMLGMEWLYKSLEKYTYITIRSIIFKIIGIILMFIFVKNSDDYITYGLITIFAVSASNILNFINVNKYIYINKKYNYYNLLNHLKPILIFFSLTAAITIYNNVDNIMLGFIVGDEAVGYYNTAVRIKLLLISIVTSTGAVLLSRLSYYVEKGKETEFMILIKKSFYFNVIVATSLSVYFIIYAREIIYLLAGKNFENSIIIMQIIMPTVLFIGFTNLFGYQILVPLGRERVILCSVFLGLIVSFILNILLIPNYSYLGAALSNFLAELSVLFFQIFAIRDYLKKIINLKSLVKILISIFLAIFVSFFIKFLNLNIVLSLFTSGLIFYSVYYIILRIFKIDLILEIECQLLNNYKKLKYKVRR